jgi:hypothetical protein
MEKHKFFKTRDLLTAAIIKAKGGTLVTIDWSKEYAQFVFNNSSGEIDAILKEISSGSSTVEIDDLISSFKTLKALLG